MATRIVTPRLSHSLMTCMNRGAGDLLLHFTQCLQANMLLCNLRTAPQLHWKHTKLRRALSTAAGQHSCCCALRQTRLPEYLPSVNAYYSWTCRIVIQQAALPLKIEHTVTGTSTCILHTSHPTTSTSMRIMTPLSMHISRAQKCTKLHCYERCLNDSE